MLKVHIVATNPEADQILARKARYLRDGLGWSMSEKPRADVDVNLFFPYIDFSQSYPGWNKTRTAAYFTHHDQEKTGKSNWWQMAAEQLDLRITTAPGNLKNLSKIGTTFHARPPVDRELFKIGEHLENKRITVGVSGMVYKDNRKGEDLIFKVAGSAIGESLEWIASGRGWSFPSRWRQWDQMPSFYRSLDLFLCASRLEGVPMPPLEALTVGTPVIVPRGVGMMDELPDIPGIYKFKSGSYRSLLHALKKAVDGISSGEIDRKALHVVTKEYTPVNWCNDFKTAVDTLMPKKAKAVSKPTKKARTKPKVKWSGDPEDWRSRAGMYCVAFGKASRKCAVTCIESFKKQMPGIPVAFAGTKKLGPEDIFIKMPDIDIGGRLAKMAVYREAPESWEYILYLDADTEVVGDISFLYQLLIDGWEALICKDMVKYHIAGMMIRPDNKEEYNATMRALGTGEALQYNGGVIAFRRCERVERFFVKWNEEWQRWAARDQGALLRALHSNPIKLFLLTNIWNASTRYILPKGEVAIHHHNMKARRWGGLIYGRTDSEEAWQRVKTFESHHR